MTHAGTSRSALLLDAVQLRSPVNETDVQPVRIGRLVSRTPQFTTINVNGRNVKVRRDTRP